MKTCADAIGPWKRYLVTVKATLDASGNRVDVDRDGVINEADDTAVANDAIVKSAQQRGLLVHTWTFRSEPRRLAATCANDPAKECEQFFAMGVNGVFGDFPDTAVKARDAWWARR